MKIAFFSSEVFPFSKTGGLADVAYALPIALEKEGHQVVVVTPFYRAVKDSGEEIEKINDAVFCARIGRGIKVYFIANDSFFGRSGFYGDEDGDYRDNLERFSYYCNKGLEILKETGFKPQIINAHDWESALIPVLLKFNFRGDDFYRQTKVVLTIHNMGYQGIFPAEDFPMLNLDGELFSAQALEFYGKINVLKGGIIFSDIVNTVSPTYAREIMTKEYGFGLEGVLHKRRGSLCGILNGVDYDVWDPRHDGFIFNNFSARDHSGKRENKAGLQKLCRLPVDENAVLIGIVSRMAEQKGFDLLAENIARLCGMGTQFVILGTGDIKYQDIFKGLALKNPKNISVNIKFDDPLAHKIYAGSDIFLMPSKYEPCGLGQLIALRYGSIPVAFKTGGLADTVNPENGFLFSSYDSKGLVNAVKDALCAFKDREKWIKLVSRAMRCDFSWQSCAKEYLKIYEKTRSA